MSNIAKLFSFGFISVLLLTPSLSYGEKAAILVIRKTKAPIYKKASFDSRIIAYAPKGKKLYGTKNTRPGIEGFGLFHKVRLKKGVFGYVLDTDVLGFKKQLKKKSETKRSKLGSTKLGSSRKNKKRNKKKKKSRLSKNYGSKNSQDRSESRMNKWKGYPLSFIKAYGLSFGMTDYTSEFGGGEISSQESVFGLKLSGPGWFFKNIPLDINIAAHFGGVESLSSVSQIPSSGFFVLSDVSFPFRLKHSKSWSLYGGIGLLVNYFDFDYRINSINRSSSGVNMGAVGTLGFVYNYGNWLFKVEPRFYWDKAQYFGVIGSIQRVL